MTKPPKDITTATLIKTAKHARHQLEHPEEAIAKLCEALLVVTVVTLRELAARAEGGDAEAKEFMTQSESERMINDESLFANAPVV